MLCSYPDGATPYWGDGGRAAAKETLKKIVQVSSNINDNDLKVLNEIESYLNGTLKPQFAKFPSINIVTDRTGYSKNKDSAIFMNAKVGGPHGHHDTLALLFYYHGRELLKDTGTTSYDSKNSAYSFQKKETKSHNTIEINNKAQDFEYDIKTEGSNIDISGNSSLTTITSYTNANSSDEGDKFLHYRNVTFAKSLGEILIVSDYVKSPNSNNNLYTQNWHTEPGTESIILNDQFNTGKTNYSSGSNLIITQANTSNMSATINEGYDASTTSKTKYFTYTKNAVGDVSFQTVLYPTMNNISEINIEPISLLSTANESSVRININDNNNPNKIIYSYTSFSEQRTGEISDINNNKTFVTNASHFVVSYDKRLLSLYQMPSLQTDGLSIQYLICLFSLQNHLPDNSI